MDSPANATAPDPYPPGADPPWTVAGHDDPTAWFVQMAEERPVAHDEGRDIWHLCGHRPVMDFLRDHELWSTAKRLEAVAPEDRLVRLLTSDPPLHVGLRKQFSHAYRPRRMRQLEDHIRSRAQIMIADCVSRKRFDVVSELAAPLSASLIGDLIGVEESEQIQLMRFGTSPPLGGVVTEDDRHSPLFPVMLGYAGQQGNKATEFFDILIDERRTSPRDDLVSALAQIPEKEIEGRIDVGALLLEQLGAGQSTTTHAISSLLHHLCSNPDQAAILRANRELAASAVEEAVRCSAPIQARQRIATQDFELPGGHVVRSGSLGLGWLQAANLDPTVFEDPTKFDITRNPNPHIAFGFGVHYCLGQGLARMETRVVLEELLDRTDDVQRVSNDPIEWADGFIIRGPRELIVEVEPSKHHRR